jgi:hypothetical protein
MRQCFRCFVPLILILLVSFVASAQQSAGPQPSATSQPIRDSQAISVLNQALNGAGGLSAINAIKDYTASGNITYHWNTDVQGAVTLSGSGLNQFRVDASLPKGMRSFSTTAGRMGIKLEDGTVSWLPREVPTPGKPITPIPSSDAFPYQLPKFAGSLAVPYLQLAAVVSDQRYTILYKGIVQIDGHSLHDIQVLPPSPSNVEPMSKYQTSDFFIDTSTLQLTMTEDTVPKHVVHQIRYSNYKATSGVLIPFSISEEMGGQNTYEIQMDQISFNTGHQDSDFSL